MKNQDTELEALRKEIESLRAELRELFSKLTYEEQEEIINLIKSKRQNDAE